MRQWRCTVCGYIHKGPEPPEECPVCHAPREAFVEIEAEGAAEAKGPAPVTPTAKVEPTTRSASQPVPPMAAGGEDGAKSALFDIQYGMFVVGSRNGERFNAQTCNTVFQVVSLPVPRIAVGINKSNLTHEFITASHVLTVTTLGKGNMHLIKQFGFSSGRDVDKFGGAAPQLSPTVACPVIPEGVSYLECRVQPEHSVDVGTHTLFICDVVGGGKLNTTEPITYGFYRANRNKPGDMVDDVDWNNVVAALNLEFGANRRYQYQQTRLIDPQLSAVLEGVMRTEGEHVDNNMAYLERRLEEKLGGQVAPGLLRSYLFMMLDEEFEQVAKATYQQFANETQDAELRELFTEQARSEHGHIAIFKELVDAMAKGTYATAFFCPLCGWELKTTSDLASGTVVGCPKCGARFEVGVEGGSWSLKRLS